MKRALPTGEVALASKIFEQFFAAEVYEDIMACHQVAMLQNVFFSSSQTPGNEARGFVSGKRLLPCLM
jgi:hypothetical protein